jgi:hypothetical protein
MTNKETSPCKQVATAEENQIMTAQSGQTCHTTWISHHSCLPFSCATSRAFVSSRCGHNHTTWVSYLSCFPLSCATSRTLVCRDTRTLHTKRTHPARYLPRTNQGHYTGHMHHYIHHWQICCQKTSRAKPTGNNQAWQNTNQACSTWVSV